MNLYRSFGNTQRLTLGAAKKKSTSKKGAAGASFDAGGTPLQLWKTDPAKRRVDFSGLFSTEDTLVAIAKGMAPGVLDKMEDRATIKGGVAALKALGISPWKSKSITGLQTRTVQSEKDDAALVKAAGKGSNLRSAAKYIQSKVAQNHLSQAAWGARQGYILANIKGFAVAHGVVASALNFLPVPGVAQIASAVGAAHIAITTAIATDLAKKAAYNVTAGLAYAKKKKGAKTTKKATSVPRAAASVASSARTKAASSSTRAKASTSSSQKASSSYTEPSSSEEEETTAPEDGARDFVSSGGLKKQGQGMPRASSSQYEDSSAASSSASSGISPWWWAGGVAALVLGGLVVMNRGKGAARISVRSTPTAKPAANRITLRRKP